LNRAFFSLQSNWVPTVVALANLGVNAALDAAFYSFGVWGIPLSTSFVNIAGTAALLVLLRRRVGNVDARATGRTFVLVTVASGVLAAVSWTVWDALDGVLGRSTGAQLVSLATALVAGIGAYLIACKTLRVRELEALLALRARFRRV